MKKYAVRWMAAVMLLLAVLCCAPALAGGDGDAYPDGWNIIDGKKCYCVDGEFLTGIQTIDGDTYYFTDNGYLAYGVWYTVEHKEGDTDLIYFSGYDGKQVFGWFLNGEEWFYFDEVTGYKASGWVNVGGEWYLMGDYVFGMKTGWIETDGEWYYLAPSGEQVFGWRLVGSAWYYFEPDACSGVMYTGLRYVEEDDAWYYFGEDGAMRTGWVLIDGVWYYFAPNGARQTGWIYSGGRWYYLEDETLYTGYRTVWGENTSYYFDENGAMQVGWVWLDVYDCWGYFDPNGAGHDGWISAGSDWYYTIAGRCCTNMVITLRHSGTDETVRYLLDSEGVMRRNTWSLRSGGYWYYFGEDGAAYTNGTYRIGGEDFYFDEEGKCYR